MAHVTSEPDDPAVFYPDFPTVGELARDTRTHRLGVVMDQFGNRVQLRPERGGHEWDAAPGDLLPVTAAERLWPRVWEANRRGTGRAVRVAVPVAGDGPAEEEPRSTSPGHGMVRVPADQTVPSCPFPCSLCREKGRQ